MMGIRRPEWSWCAKELVFFKAIQKNQSIQETEEKLTYKSVFIILHCNKSHRLSGYSTEEVFPESFISLSNHLQVADMPWFSSFQDSNEGVSPVGGMQILLFSW
jgi:hypothetical protein